MEIEQDWRDRLRTGEPGNWWNRNLDAILLLLAATFVTLCLLAWYAYGRPLAAGFWGLRTAHTTSLDGSPVKLPAGWRPSIGRSDLHLERPHAWRTPIEFADVDDLSGPDLDYLRTLNTLRSVEKLAVENGDVAADSPLGNSRFVCLEHGPADRSTLSITCLARDGRRVIRMYGPGDQARPDFAAILATLAAAPISTTTTTTTTTK